MQQENNLSQQRGFSVPVDLIRTVAIIGVILLHATNDFTPDSMSQFEIYRWIAVDIYQSFARIGVPLFVMLTGALLLQPSKEESLKSFFKKRWTRIGIPFLFWGAIYFAWLYFADNQAVTANTIIQGLLTGPYLQFWYIYMLAGLYLLTPILRIVMAHADNQTIKYFIVIWVLGASIMPTIGYFTSYNLDTSIFAIVGWVGYYILGTYLLTVKIRRSILVTFTSVGVALAAAGTYFMASTVGGPTQYYFQEYLSPTMIFASVMFFLLLNTVKMSSTKTAPTKAETDPKPSNPAPSIPRKLAHLISKNTLPIFMLHLIVLYSLQRGYFGFTINGATINSIIGVPIITVITLFICLAIIVPLKKVPYLKQLIG
jgi:surface polysaccharide O-acyltransferase-like enzyme